MASMAKQFALLLWKNFLLQKRKVLVTVFEIGLPIAFAALFVVIRVLVKSENIDHDSTWEPFPVNNFSVTPLGKENFSLFYSPNTTVVNDLMVKASTHIDENVTVRGFSSEEELSNEYIVNSEIVWAAVVFDDGADYTSNMPNDVKYAIRCRPKSSKNSDRWRTSNTFAFFRVPGYRNNDQFGKQPYYYETGFLGLQWALDRAIIENVNASAEADMNTMTVNLQKMPYPSFYKDNLIPVVQSQFPLFIMLSFILNALQTTKNIVYEKERKLKETMKMMGLSSFIYWLSWFFKQFIFLVICLAFYTLLITVNFGEMGSVLQNSHAALIFVFLLCYGISIICFCFFISTLFQKANTGAYAGGLLYFISYVPYFFLQNRYEDMSRGAKLGVSLLPNVAMALGMNTIGIYEGTGFGAQWNNFNRPATVDDNFSLLNAMVMLLIDSAIFLVLTWYIDTVHPGEFGVPQPFYFPFTKSYWCATKHNTSDTYDDIRDERMKSDHMEVDPVGLAPGISIRSLRKEFKSGKKKKMAVNNMSLNMYEGQITVLLGHNGAGKSTTTMMLTGFIPPTGGTAFVNGYDISCDIANVRQSLGLCPQHNVLFDLMTVEEHLILFGQLKGCPADRLKAEVDDMIRLVGLEEKRKDMSAVLSGGQKRKLSVGIALIADSKVVILDEPTSGMDPGARRQTWEILQRCREGRTIILTTHFMDEADILGDRIAIMAEGVVKCCGTSLFLKKLYGAGYHLVMVKDKSCDVSKVTSVIRQYVPTATCESEVGAELSFLLPFDQSSHFEALFLAVEGRKQELGISSFGTTATTMEEVFLKCAPQGVGESAKDYDEDIPIGIINPAFTKDANAEKTKSVTNGSVANGVIHDQNSIPLQNMESTNHIEFNRYVTKNEGLNHALQQYFGMFLKKAIHTWRNRVITAVQLVLPVIFTILALVVEKTIPKAGDEPSLTLDLSPFPGSHVAYSAGINPNDKATDLSTSYAGLFTPSDLHDLDRNQFPTFNEYFLHTANEIGTETYVKSYIIGGDFQSPQNADPMTLTAHFGDAPYHSPAISLHYMMQGMLQYYGGSKITTVNHPFPKNASQSSTVIGATAGGTAFMVAFNVLFGMAFLASSFIIFLIKEKATGSKHLQFVSGVEPFAYWMSTFLWDIINFAIPCLVLLVVFAAFGTTAYVDDHRLLIVLLILCLYGWSIMPFVYIWHYLFSTPATGMVVMTMLNILTGLATLMAVYILKFPSLGAVEVGEGLDWVFLTLLPNYCLGQSLMNVYTNNEYQQLCADPDIFPPQMEAFCGILPHPCCQDNCGDNCFTYQDNYLDWRLPGVGRYLIFMAFQGVLYFTVMFMIEFGLVAKLRYYLCGGNGGAAVGASSADISIEQGVVNASSSEDSDVRTERQRINTKPLTSLMETDALILKNLTKSYGYHLAVDRLCLGIPKHECFGLLGQNGAGKTTTFKMLTGDIYVSRGNAYLAGFDIKQEMKEVYRNLGYCPQFDALIDQMTGKETLTMYARLRGIRENQIKKVVNDLIDTMMLRKHADKLTMEYSGGNKRKLSTAIALIGDPPFIFLDEPTTGMDPAARRQLWNVLSQVRSSGRTLILTSHSMEECDALCTRLVIMVNGQLMCLGSPQHLKNKYGEGYTLEIRVGMTKDGVPQPMAPLIEFVKSMFPLSHVFDDKQGYIHFQVPDAGVPLAKLFGVMEQAKTKFSIEDYAVHQTTLEQIFLTFTRMQIPPREKTGKGICNKICGCC